MTLLTPSRTFSKPPIHFDSSEPESLLRKTIADRYKIESIIDRGGTSIVYKGYDELQKTPVAIKLFHHIFNNLLPFAVAEIMVASQIRHPNIVRALDWGFIDQSFFVAFEYLAGSCLEKLLSEGSFPWDHAKEIVLQMGLGFSALHEIGLCNFDVKPDNIIITNGTNDPAVHLIDFGTIRKMGKPTRPPSGTPAYMAPELFGGGELTSAVDVYSFGTMLYEIFVGRLPFQSDSIVGYVEAHLLLDPPRPSQIAPTRLFHPQFEDALLTALQKAPEDRFASIADMMKVIEACEYLAMGCEGTARVSMPTPI